VTSLSPFGETYEYELDHAAERRRVQEFADRFAGSETQIVVVQGIGFVGAAMLAALAEARMATGQPAFAIIGVDLSDEENYWKIARVESGLAPVASSDARIAKAYSAAKARGNLIATYSSHAYACADIVVVDVHLDIALCEGGALEYEFSYEHYLSAIESVARSVTEDTLVVIETTVPPGTTDKVIRPLFAKWLAARELDPQRFFLAHSYERVMPGQQYLDSITNFYRVFAGADEPSSRRARAFFEAFINTAEFPLMEIGTTTGSEMAKVLENSYRATNIAFMQEWTEFAEAAEVDLFEVIDAIRVRPTHRNIMAPGFGVGGYCLTKDALLADWALQTHFGGKRRLDMSLEAVRVNDRMPLHTFSVLKEAVSSVEGLNVALLGVSYRAGVADTRSSPSGSFYDRCLEAGATVSLHDPMLSFWPDRGIPVEQALETFAAHAHDVVVFAVRHPEYLSLTGSDVLEYFPSVRYVIDANNVLADAVARDLGARGVRVLGIGKGHWGNDL